LLFEVFSGQPKGIPLLVICIVHIATHDADRRWHRCSGLYDTVTLDHAQITLRGHCVYPPWYERKTGRVAHRISGFHEEDGCQLNLC